MKTKLIRYKLLEAALRGMIVPQNENDEPVSCVLDKIRNARNESKSKIEKTVYDAKVIEFPFDIPDNWAWIKFSEYIDVRDGTHDSPQYYDTGVPFVTSKNLKDGKIDFSSCKLISQEDHEKFSKRSCVDDGDILYAMIGSIGNPVIVKKDRDFSIKNVALFKPYVKELTNMQYVYYYLLYIQEKLKQNPSGGLQPFIGLNTFRNYLFPFPPIEEQQRIVSAVEEGFAYIDAVEATKQALIDAAENVRTKILQSAFNGSLTESNTENWQKVTLQSITHSVGKKDNQILASAVQKDGKFKVVSQAQELFDGYYDDESKVINDLPIIIFGDHNRNVKYIDFPFIIGADGTKCMKAEGANPKYLYYWVQYAASTIPHRGYARHFSLLKAIPVPLPSQEEQQRIVAKIEELFAEIDKLK